MAINDRFMRAMDDVLLEMHGDDFDGLAPASPKSYARMLAKMMSTEDHLLRAPRSSDAAFERSASMTRLLVGDELGDALELPWSLPGRRRARWALLRRCGTQAPVLFRQALERTRTPSAMSTVLVPRVFTR